MRRITTKVLSVLAVLTMAAGIAWAAVNFHGLSSTGIGSSTFCVHFDSLTGLGSAKKVAITLSADITCQTKSGTTTQAHKTKTDFFDVVSGNAGPGDVCVSCPGSQVVSGAANATLTATLNGEVVATGTVGP